MSNAKKIRELEASIKKMQKENERIFGKEKKKKSYTIFVLIFGLILIFIGFMLLFDNTYDKPLFLYLKISHFVIPNGSISLILIMGLLLLYFLRNNLPGIVVTIIGFIAIIAPIFTMIEFYKYNNKYKLILTLLCIIAGGALSFCSIIKKIKNKH